jgi:hypothetical protein
MIHKIYEWLFHRIHGPKIRIPVSAGELFDKYYILSIKLNRIKDQTKWEHVRTEWGILNKYIAEIEKYLENHDLVMGKYFTLVSSLGAANRDLWDIEDRLRELEADHVASCLETGLSGAEKEFVHLAREVYKVNDKRSQIKKELNKLFKSEIIEEKSYKGGEL